MQTCDLSKLLTFLVLVLLTGCTRNSTSNQNRGTLQPGIKSESVVQFASEAVQIPSGGSFEATVHVSVKNGYHVNANPPTFPYLKATELELNPSGGISVSFIKYPNAKLKKFPFADQPVAIYEGDTELKILLKAAPTAAKGSSNLAGKLKVQACDDQVCYPPGEIAIAIPVTLK
jgi:DsbC/DsbD-like thiol-disulfide interchange protein